ncbi:GNAT family N-acetyltransferase [Deinococcus hopiensis]|uniref:Diamine N-acetyltransferase n=1 Tax=Deinococcus hopiensis KR-140 TaxID=695939 RepID=A0A1W1VV59_9DEIO|nr:GNAT family N-acetyltransferase [Deinococcus hopiensis]SMB97153.1 diamine N-acetyltransferase [Deinococcus hopiensis KR-140]
MLHHPFASTHVTVEPVTSDNWRAVVALQVKADQRDFVNPPVFNLVLCRYSPIGWSPLAVRAEGQIIGFLMWAIDPEDDSCWLGGVMVDGTFQGRGYGKQAVEAALAAIGQQHGHRRFALSYHPSNTVARSLYLGLGFQETGEMEDEEVVARWTTMQSSM